MPPKESGNLAEFSMGSIRVKDEENTAKGLQEVPGLIGDGDGPASSRRWRMEMKTQEEIRSSSGLRRAWEETI